MGKVASKLMFRTLKNFNVENRAHKLIDKSVKPIAAPLHKNSEDYIKEFVKGFLKEYDNRLAFYISIFSLIFSVFFSN